MRVDSFGDARPGVSQNHPDGGLINLRPVKQCSQGMAALVGCVLHSDGVHGFIPEPTEAVVGAAWADYPGLFPLREHAQDKVMDGNLSDSGSCLRMLDVDVPLPDVDVCRSQSDKLSDSHACINEDKGISNAGNIQGTPEFSYLPGCERLLFVDDGVLRELDEWAQIVVNDAIFNGVLIHLAQQNPALLARAVASFDGIDSGL